jgi:hypothetical protein
MSDKPISSEPLSQTEIRLIEQLRKHPEIRDRVQSILELASNTEGPLKSADEVEELLNALANGYAVLKELNYYSYLYSPTNQLASVYGEPAWDADYLHDIWAQSDAN